jgi:hypothetical protein
MHFFACLSVSPHYQFLQGGRMICFHQTVAVSTCPHTDRISSAFLSTTTRWKWNIHSVYLATSFVWGGGRYNLPNSCSTGLYGSLQSIWCVTFTWQWCSFTQLWDGRLHFHKLWHIQNIPDACCTCSAVPCVLFENTHTKKGREFPACVQAAASSSARASLAMMCYKKLI